ncbi:MAG: two-component regulator propeller domain-containing protein [Flavobacteriales bacterium]
MKSTLVFFSCIVASSCFGQSFKFRQFNEQNGLNNKFIYSIDQDEQGYLMVGTGEGLFRFDGFSFRQYTTTDGIADDFITCSLKDNEQNIWFGHGNGTITRYSKNKFQKIDLSALTVSRINQIYQSPDGRLWAVAQNDGLLMHQADNSWKKINKGIEEFTLYTMCIDSQGVLWIGTDMGLLKAAISNDDEVKYDFVEEIFETKVSSMASYGTEIFVGTDESGVFRIVRDNTISHITALKFDSINFSSYNVNNLMMDNEQRLWLSSNNHGLLQLGSYATGKFKELTDYSHNATLGHQSVRITFVDREGNVWLGTMGQGLLKLEDDYFSVYSVGTEELNHAVNSIFTQNDTIWYGTHGQVIVSFEMPDNVLSTYGIEHGLPASDITALYCDSHAHLWAGTAESGLYHMPFGKKKFEHVMLSADALNQRINDLVEFNNILYVATDYGVYQLNGGVVVSHLSIQSGLTHNVVKSLYRDSHGRIWISTHDRQLSYVQDGVIYNLEATSGGGVVENKCIVEDNNGNIWVGTNGSGVFMFSDTKEVLFDKSKGLYSDYCYSLECDNRNYLWVGHRGALSKINLITGKIEIVDPSRGFEYAFLDNAVDKFANGIMIFGTDNGMLRYEPDKDRKNLTEPLVHIESLLIGDSLHELSQFITLPYGEFKLEIDFIGVSLKNPEGVTYQYMLERYDTDWSEPGTGSVAVYNKLSSGEYIFKVKAFNADAEGGSTITSFSIFIDKPFWLKWWFLLSTAIALVLVVRYIIVQRERKLKQDQERLQYALNEATHEVMEQKELLEVKNKDITDSILYAKNIQRAMLPAYESLNQYFADAFVYFKPRDIVSGDFYWIEKFDNDVVVSCADCTGHGVPGAFMSLIGTTLLKEVSSDKSVQCARDVLVRLDNDLKMLLNKRGSDFGVEDGMDISVFNYNFHKNKIMVASANRPVLLRIKGEWIEVKGDRLSIGGSDAPVSKVFSQYEFDVHPGDIIYMFSDGITDQFGGEEGKKLKRSGLYNLLKQYADLPMNEQRAALRESFYTWRGLHEQIDDIIVMGMRF